MKHSMKKIISLVLVLAMSLAISVPGFAATSPKAEKIDIDTKILNSDIRETSKNNIIPMGASKPTQTWNWSSGTYYGSADFNTAVYSNYNFQPSSNGELYVDFSGYYTKTIPSTDTGLTIECISSSNGSYVSWQTTIPSSSGKVTGGVRFYNLNTSDKYFFRISKPYPDYPFHLDFKVYR
ncbi:hypothetical protein ACRQU7_18685 [Caproiciproducens sp. R1]|uniref:hypothetical protein n=1 Tax=Caproiciproducens sp. R1 TaxID=3435000 RepID=UPI004033CF05|nr:hypothetical protein [Oscillospiraceae bacterium]